jgi:hypothetical protein
MIPNEICQQIKHAFITELQEKYHLVDTDYNDSFNHLAKTFQEGMDNHDAYHLFEITDNWISNYQYSASQTIIDELKDEVETDSKYVNIHPYIEEWLDDDENREQLRYSIMERDHSTPINEIIRRTKIRARVTQYTNYDCLPSNWDMQNTYHYEDYVKDIVDTLCLNPWLVKQTFIKAGITAAGRWPDLSCRNGKEAVEYVAFARELHNQSCYCHFVYMGMLPLESMYQNGFRQHHQIVIPKGNSCGLFGSWNGGGSILEMTLKRDLELPLRLPKKTKYDHFELEIDERNCGNGYCIDEVYGLITNAWGKEIRLVYES